MAKACQRGVINLGNEMALKANWHQLAMASVGGWRKRRRKRGENGGWR
jgi:hypothetical protein